MLNRPTKSRRGIALAIGLSVVTGAGVTPLALSAAMAQTQQNEDKIVVEVLDVGPDNFTSQPIGGPDGGGQGPGDQPLSNQPPAGPPPGGPMNPFGFGSGGYGGGGGGGGGGGPGGFGGLGLLAAIASSNREPDPINYRIADGQYDLSQATQLELAIIEASRSGRTSLADLLNFASSKGIKLQTIQQAINNASSSPSLPNEARTVLTQANTRITTALQGGASGDAVNVAFTLTAPNTGTASTGQTNVAALGQPLGVVTPSSIYIG